MTNRKKPSRVQIFLKTLLQFLLNPRLLLCLGIGWMITNGWSYLCLALGIRFDIPWMIAVASAYLAFLWFPFTPEKIVTVAIAIFLLRWWFPHDEKTLGVLRQLALRTRQKKHKKGEPPDGLPEPGQSKNESSDT